MLLKNLSILSALMLLIAFPAAQGQDYSIEVIQEAPDADALSAELLGLMSDKGMRIKKGGTRTVAEIWLCKQWPLEAEFERTDERLYPFTPGQLIGILHFRRRGSEFRDQTVSSGWYTLRFGLQPVDGNHEGTSPTRDFLMLVDAAQDAPDKQWSVEDLQQASAAAAGSTHPAMLCLQPPEEADSATSDDALSIRHDDLNDWWVARTHGKGVGANDRTQTVALEVVVVGHALE